MEKDDLLTGQEKETEYMEPEVSKKILFIAENKVAMIIAASAAAAAALIIVGVFIAKKRR